SKAATFITGGDNLPHFKLKITIQLKKDSISTTVSDKSRGGGHKTDFTGWSDIIQLSHPTTELTGRTFNAIMVYLRESPIFSHIVSLNEKKDSRDK
ncbi:MAG TPA: hypothetical protein VFQ47_00005, partial [Nitrososphaera sp.]|nr:hypothetical protein [Nitrososphaera sp.]